MDTEVNRFLIEFHRRQRAQLLVPESRWARVVAWFRDRAEDFRPAASLSYASGFAAVALATFLGFSPQVHVARDDGQYKLSLGQGSAPTLAMVPATFTHDTATPAANNNLTFTPVSGGATATRFILGNPRVAYDATAAF